jgi:hypothetical protein
LIPVPLRAPDRDVVLNLAALVGQTYERGRYANALRYGGPPPVPLSSEDAVWAEELARPMRQQQP